MNFHPRLAFEPLSTQNDYQAKALRQLLEYARDRSPFYQKLFSEHKINIDNIKSVRDLEFLPTTSKMDMQEHNWDFLCVPDHEIKEYTATSGTLGKPVTIALTENDLQRLAYNEHQSFLCADGKPTDVYQLMLTLDRQFMAGMAYYSGLRQMGAALVRTGPGLPSMQWDTINRLQSNSIVAVPSFMLKLIEHAQENQIDLKHTPVHKAVCIGESIRAADFELNTLGQRIYDQWPIKFYNTYASTEMQTAFTECTHGMGGHEQPDLVIMEIVDDHGKAMPPVSYGEVTITTLGIEGMPLIRYRTGDIACYYDSPCACGRMSRRLSPVLGRKQQMIKYKGTTIYPPAIFDILNEIPFVQEYVIEVFTNDLGTDELKLHLHTLLPVDDAERKLKPILQGKLRVSPLLHFHSSAEMLQMQFPTGSRKQVKFVDNR
ncbi:phenylacetate--CoA ligase family protein [Polluticoccus soli]|uniref:phenylacetate--CoA ligase family protein n=1 Tax=Polluticoccus soli TaxID=3034150 RepID=UPI0023E28C29|nr:AMP-binding protein [Flavipsychrobacter sp. JY13-12]